LTGIEQPAFFAPANAQSSQHVVAEPQSCNMPLSGGARQAPVRLSESIASDNQTSLQACTSQALYSLWPFLFIAFPEAIAFHVVAATGGMFANSHYSTLEA